MAGIIEIERIGQHAVGGHRPLVEVPGEVKTAPTAHAGKRDRIPGRAPVERVIRLVAARRRPDDVLWGAGGDRSAEERRAAPRDLGWEFRPRLSAVGRIAKFLIAPPLGDADDETRIGRRVIDRKSSGKRVPIGGTISRGIGVGIGDIKETPIIGGEHRVSAGGHNDFNGDQIFDARGLVGPGHWRVLGRARRRRLCSDPYSGAAGEDHLTRIGRIECRSADAHEHVASALCGGIGVCQPRNVRRRHLVAGPHRAGPGCACIIADVQVSGGRHGDDLVRIGRIDRDGLNSLPAIVSGNQLRPCSVGVTPETRNCRRPPHSRRRCSRRPRTRHRSALRSTLSMSRRHRCFHRRRGHSSRQKWFASPRRPRRRSRGQQDAGDAFAIRIRDCAHAAPRAAAVGCDIQAVRGGRRHKRYCDCSGSMAIFWPFMR